MAGDITLCAGCRDDYYNGKGREGSIGGDGCSSLKSATVGDYYVIHWWTQPTVPGAFTAKRTNSCWHSPGNFSKCKPEAVPPFARGRDGKHPVTSHV
jgi:hypothetical protein